MEDTQNPYAAPTAPPPLPGELVDDSVKADRGLRLVARLIDGALMMVCFVPTFLAIAIDPGNKEPSGLQMAMMALSVLAALGLFVYQCVLLNQHSQTLGKRWLKIKIVRNDGSPCSFGRIFGLRMFVIALIEQVPCLGALFALVNALWIFGAESRCLHDLICDTKVVNA
ncbi:RDD family protein [Lysobacter enzymogenes]|uniref:RDD family n=1 Tax=Lysobacter enzymogenes TaxID=69 RepID=A0A0S2DPM4_LYSEN|nr:RDD family protein [Lysobacter enzymogenes]ALN60345.1 RDD family [Lysobacter enzymogenes]QCW28297.1 RDD family protein [Lysobacter enzymogenes]QQQ01690.1 RDD family protein [Lysobacter enzymogenes]UZW60963.1 RDD family protein [Lysobacter enzymogenes]